jgi:hypothetical protein
MVRLTLLAGIAFLGRVGQGGSLRAYPELPFTVCHSEAKPKNLANEIEILHFAALRSE